MQVPGHQIKDGTIKPVDQNEYVAATGSANAYTVAFSPALASYADGLEFTFEVSAANTGSSTLNAGAGAKTIKKFNAGGTLMDVVADELPAGFHARVSWDASADAWILQGLPGSFMDLRNTIGEIVGAMQANGTVVEQAATPDMTVRITSELRYFRSGLLRTLAPGSSATIATAHASQSRTDLVCINLSDTMVSSSTDVALKGVEDGSNTAPSVPVGYVKLAEVSVPANDTAITDSQITGVPGGFTTQENAALRVPAYIGSTTIPNGPSKYASRLDLAEDLENLAHYIWKLRGTTNVFDAWQGRPAPTGYIHDLRIAPFSGAENNKIQIDISQIEVSFSGGRILVDSISVTADITVSGQGGLDTGTEAAATWYYVWFIYKSDGTKAALLSASSTNPTMPAGTWSTPRIIGAVRNDAASNFLKQYQYNEEVCYAARQQALNDGSSTTFATVSLSSFVPPGAQADRAYISLHAAATGDVASDSAVDISIDGTNVFATTDAARSGADNQASWGAWWTPLPTSQQVWYRVGNANIIADVEVMGYRLRLL